MQKGNANEWDEAAIESALGKLPRFDAPVNFEARVRSRIAEGQGSPGWALALKFALPTIALLLLGAYFFIPGEASPENIAVAPVNAQTEKQADNSAFPDAPGPVAENLMAKNQLASGRANGQPPTNSNLQVGRLRTVEQPGGGSQDRGLGQEPETIYPPGLDPNKKLEPRTGAPTGRGISAETILSMLGIRADCGGTGCVAAAVTRQGIADKAGVKAGDVIEAIDDKSIKAGTVFEGAVTVNSLRVVRSGKRITLGMNAK